MPACKLCHNISWSLNYGSLTKDWRSRYELDKANLGKEKKKQLWKMLIFFLKKLYQKTWTCISFLPGVARWCLTLENTLHSPERCFEVLNSSGIAGQHELYRVGRKSA
jgi:hypothetical protein